MASIDEDDIALDAFFSAGRAHPAAPPAALFERIAADAEAVLAEARDGAARDGRAPRGAGGLLAGLAAALGGWPAVAGLASAAVAGLWIGAAQPSLLTGVAGWPAATGTDPAATAETVPAAGYDLTDLMAEYYDVAEGG